MVDGRIFSKNLRASQSYTGCSASDDFVFKFSQQQLFFLSLCCFKITPISEISAVNDSKIDLFRKSELHICVGKMTLHKEYDFLHTRCRCKEMYCKCY
jgi:hypothetical protein